jgi:hypothetical protein
LGRSDRILEDTVKGIGTYLLGAAVLAAIGGGCLAAGMLDRQLAWAQQRVAAEDYGEPEAALETAEQYVAYVASLPWIGSSVMEDIHTRRTAIRYWRRQYQEIVGEQADPVGSIASDNLEMQFIVANAVYRVGESSGRDQHATLDALDTAIAGYATLLKNAARHERAAYNYEYVVRLRRDFNKQSRKPRLSADAQSPHGRASAPAARAETKQFKTLIPLDSEERKNEGVAGKATPIKRKG